MDFLVFGGVLRWLARWVGLLDGGIRYVLYILYNISYSCNIYNYKINNKIQNLKLMVAIRDISRRGSKSSIGGVPDDPPAMY